MKRGMGGEEIYTSLLYRSPFFFFFFFFFKIGIKLVFQCSSHFWKESLGGNGMSIPS
jgi:hypothetical protein